MGLQGSITSHYSNLGDTPFGKGSEERTGVKVTYLHPPVGGGSEQFNLIVASGDFPDIFNANWMNYPGGPEKAIADGVIVKLNDVLDKYAPNLKNVYKNNPDWEKQTKTDTGTFFCFPMIRGDERLSAFRGLMLRKDWLDELGLKIPETFDDWRTVLRAFKEIKNSTVPFTALISDLGFYWGFGIDQDFYVGDDGKIHYGYIESGYREYLALMNQWMREGLLDPDSATLTSQQINAKMTSGASGASYGNLGGAMGTWTNAARSKDPKYLLTAAPIPVKNRGEKPGIKPISSAFVFNGGNTAISGSCKNLEIAVRYFDWGYSEEGSNYYNYGTPGVSYNMINGYPTYTDLIMKNPQGWSIGDAISAYAMSSYGGPFVQAWPYYEQYMTMPEQKEAFKIWEIADPFKHVLPPLSPTPEESREYAQIMSECLTYIREMRVKFIMGTESLSNWDSYITQLKKMNIDRAVELQSVAYNRYKTR
jgi:putative aldouronate transport system substrate-binding protein